MPINRSYSAPPIDELWLDDEVELEKIHYELKYTNFYRKNKNPRLDPPKPHIKNISYWSSEFNDYIIKAFTDKKTTVEIIDMEFPDSESCSEFSGKSRTTTPIGDNSFVFPDLVQKSENIHIIPLSCVTKKTENNLVLSELKLFYDTLGLEPTNNPSTICVAVCKDQEGSRLTQSLIEQWDKSQINYFFEQILSASLDLSTNLFGNYVIQKIIPYLHEEQAFNLILQFFGHIFELSMHVYGCRVIQKLIDHMNDIKSIVAELENKIGELIASPNGNHVVQKCIDKDIDKDFLLKEFQKDCIKLAQQRYGCRVLQRLFEVCTEEETWDIYIQIIQNIDILINDKYGNYVIQHLIETYTKFRGQIFEYIITNSFNLSRDKFSSNVVEKCVNNCTAQQLEMFLNQFSVIADDSRPCLYHMCTDMYANYVVQRFFDVANEDIKLRAKNIIKPYIKEMRSIPFTKHILLKLL